MSVRRVAALASQTLTAGTSMVVIIALVKYECFIVCRCNKMNNVLHFRLDILEILMLDV